MGLFVGQFLVVTAEQRTLEQVFTGLLRSDPSLLPLESEATVANAANEDDLIFLAPDLRKEAHESADRVLQLEEQLAEVDLEVEAAKELPGQTGPTTKERLVDVETRYDAS